MNTGGRAAKQMLRKRRYLVVKGAGVRRSITDLSRLATFPAQAMQMQTSDGMFYTSHSLGERD